MKMKAAEWYRERVRELEDDPGFLLEMVKLAFAEELCRLLDEKGMSRGQLAERLGTSRAYVTRILRTDYNLTAETMVKVARALDARVELALVSKDAPSREKKVAAGTPRRRERKYDFVAADRATRSDRNDFVASDSPRTTRLRTKPSRSK